MSANGRITASHVGTSPTQDYNKRTCYRCGISKHANGRVDRTKPYLCLDCKIVDRPLAVRLGLTGTVTNS